MKKSFNTILRCSLFVAGLMLACSGCYRRPLEEKLGETALVPFKIDWSESRVDVSEMKHASIWFFPHDGSKAFEWRMEGSLTETEVPLALGTYSIIVFNGTVDAGDWDAGMSFEGTDKYETFAVQTYPGVFTGFASKVDPDVRETPETFASWSLDEFKVVPDMVTRTRSKTKAEKNTAEYDEVDHALTKVTSIMPQPRTVGMKITAHIQNIKSAVKCSGTLSGMTGKVFLATGKSHTVPVSHMFPIMLGEALPDNLYSGGNIISRTLTVFRPFRVDEQPLQVNMLLEFKLGNGSLFTRQADVTEQIDRDQIMLEVTIGTSDSPIILPTINADQNVGVDDWENVDVPIGRD